MQFRQCIVEYSLFDDGGSRIAYGADLQSKHQLEAVKRHDGELSKSDGKDGYLSLLDNKLSVISQGCLD